MKYDVRTGLYYNVNNPSDGYYYSADYVDNKTNKLHTIVDQVRTEKEAISSAKRFIEKHGGKGDRILSLGSNYHYTGKNWRIEK